MPSLLSGFLISTRRNLESNAQSEIQYTLNKQLGIEASKIISKKSGISGLITVNIGDIDILETLDKLIALEENEAYFLYCLKFRPVINLLKADLEILAEAVEKHKDDIKGSYKIEVKKRHAHITTLQVIDAIAKLIPNTVNLDNPDMILSVEIIGDKLGLSIIPPKYIFSTKKANQEPEKESDNWFL